MEKQPLYYWRIGISIAGTLVIGLYFLTVLQNSFLIFFDLFLLAFITVQCGLWGHDLAHHQIFTSPRWHSVAGVACWNFIVGVSFGYWNYKHNRHHAHPNTIGEDGDIHFPVVWFAPALARGINTLQKQLLPYQKYYFLLIFSSLSPVKRSVSYLYCQKTRGALMEGIVLAAHYFAV